MVKEIIFRVDGGNIYSVAMGHIYRCIRIARLLEKKKIKNLFLMKNYSEGVEFVQSAGFDVEVMDTHIIDEEEAKKVISVASEKNAIVFIDLRTSKKFLTDLLNKYNIISIVYEDVSLEDIEPTILINPSVTALTGKNYLSKNTSYLLGTDYLILDPEIKKYRHKTFSPSIKILFVCFGGADPCNLSSRITSILLSRDDSFEINLILGPAFNHQRCIQDILEKDIAKRVKVIINCKELAPLHAKSDAAITSGGTIAYESIALGIPTLVLPSINLEACNISPFIDKGFINGIKEDVALVSDEILNQSIDSFLNDSTIRKNLYETCRLEKFGDGVFRISSYLESLNKSVNREANKRRYENTRYN